MCFKYFGEFCLLAFNHETLLGRDTWEVFLHEQHSHFFPKVHTQKNCFENKSQLNSHGLIPERKLSATGYQQLQSSNSPAGGAVAH